MHNTNNHQDGYCLLLYIFGETHSGQDSTNINVYQTTSYCLRTSKENNFIFDLNFQNTVDPSFNFAQLKEKNITSKMLLSWSASIDLAEQYQLFLNRDLNSSDTEILFYNCTSTWFGPSCRFIFDYEMDKPFDEIVNTVFKSKSRVETDGKVTCYEHLHCPTLLSCLDWREICDRKSDCFDGSDENNCWQLEVNECTENEYRCHNGQCIPIEFLRDSSLYPDCLDQTDEQFDISFSRSCPKNPSYHCEELMCRTGQHAEFPCGDGECLNELNRCFNSRTSRLPSDICFNAVACLMELYSEVDPEWCAEFCSNTNCIKDICPIIYELRLLPVLFGHVRFVFSNREIAWGMNDDPDYLCYNETLCTHFLPTSIHFDNLTCRHWNDFNINEEILLEEIKNRFRGCLIMANDTHYCNYSTMYQCENSLKCISKQRLLDGLQDCPFGDDETFNDSCSLSDIHQRFNCSGDSNKRCFASLILQDGTKNCEYGEDEFDELQRLVEKSTMFAKVCDGRIDIPPVWIDGQIESDETECEHWPCDSFFNRCDGCWTCKNGADEVNCFISRCPELYHDCFFPNDTSKVSCLPIAQAGDGVVDCVGGTDELGKYPLLTPGKVLYQFRCWNDTEYIKAEDLCNGKTNCRFNDDEIFCRGYTSIMDLCYRSDRHPIQALDFFCETNSHCIIRPYKYFRLHDKATHPSQLTTDITSIVPFSRTNSRPIEENSVIYIPSDDAWWCNRGVPIRIRMKGNTSKVYCLCPPSYYGDTCQYQNQRVSLTIQIKASSEWRSVFIFLITLIDTEKNIQSHDHIEYLPIRSCKNKFNIYLLYSTRPKNSSKHYSIQIDVFTQVAWNYRASWIFPIQFPFLPVHRLPVLLRVPFLNMDSIHRCWPPCIHGRCFHYINDQHSTFCQCKPGWSGAQCDVEHKCECALGSLCISNSICLCATGRFGPRCHLLQLSCRSESCMNGGQCVPLDARYGSALWKNSMCICPQGYVGDRCEYQQKRTRIDISFYPELPIPSSLLIHLIAIHLTETHNRTSMMKNIGFDQYSLTLFASVSFNLAFAQIINQYYLIILQNQTITLAHITVEVIPSHRCRSISELFNDTFAQQPLLKRIKYYHIPCRKQPELICFHDDVHFCICALNREADCFEFDHNMSYDCGGYNYCENEGLCFHDDLKCPTSSLCACHQCYFGSRCQFSTKGSTLSLDIILGYHILRKTGVSQQRIIVKIAIALTTFMFTFGFINSFLSFQTFREKETRNVGCCLYLFASSIISMITMIIFTLKFSFLLASQIGLIKSRSFLHIQCISVDFLRRFLISTSDWLSACVAIERAVNVSYGIKFDKAKSKKVAKWIILSVLLFTSCTYIYDPIHRRLIDDEEEQRTWCVSQYSSTVKIFDWLVSIFHFAVPFAVNCISALTVIIIAARTRSNSQKKKPFKQHLREQLQHHKHLLISSFVLVLLAVPPLVLSFLSGCMKSARDSWFYLIGYFISFIPSMMTFVVFVLPSEMYRKQFNESIKRIWQ